MEKTKTCCGCKADKPLSEFNKEKKKKDGLRPRCRICSKEHYQNNKQYYTDKCSQRRIEMTAFIQDLKSKLSCVACGEDENCCLDFHHLDPDAKDFELAAARDYSKEKILNEMEKCVCVCSNCHRKIHKGIIDVSKLVG